MVSQAIISATCCNLISFVVGTVFTWTSPVLPKFNSTIPFGRRATEEESSWIGSLLTMGAIFGPFLYGYLADKVGRKLTIILLGGPYVLSYLMLAFSKSIGLYYIARFIAGVATGGAFAVVPMYIAEIAEDSNRGMLSSSMNVLIMAGVLFSYVVGPYTSLTAFNLVSTIVPILFLMSFIMLGIESPHYHIAKGNYKAATQCLDKLRGSNKNDNELNTIKVTVLDSKKGSIFDLFRSRRLIKAIIISLALVGFQQLSGIVPVLFYAQMIFESSGSSLKAEVSSIIIGAVFFFTSFLTPLFVDKLGRKLLLYFSSVGMVLSESVLGLYFYLKDHDHDVDSISWLPVVSMIAYIITYNCGFGPLPWTVMGELFPSNVKSIASSLTSAFCWSVSFIIAKFFPIGVDQIGMGPSFWIFGSFCAISFFFIYFYVIETKGKSLQEIQEDLD